MFAFNSGNRAKRATKMIDIRNKAFTVFGLRGTGKSTFVDYIARQFKSRALVYDTLNEVPAQASYDSYTPTNRFSAAELEIIIKQIVNFTTKQSFYHLFVIDEANRFCPPKPHPLPEQVGILNDELRHCNIAVGYVARRPVQLNQDLTELAEYIFIFHLKGKADIAYLEDISKGLGDAVLALPQYHFILVNPDRSFKTYPPIEADKTWLTRAKQKLASAKSA